mmetsp:Transcript_56704/g.106460  ORF Transcript_56704/g.106460 Transcript_56704/m.106460 type:complete len:224 (+) Transcript_56704:439-1110(+)
MVGVAVAQWPLSTLAATAMTPTVPGFVAFLLQTHRCRCWYLLKVWSFVSRSSKSLQSCCRCGRCSNLGGCCCCCCYCSRCGTNGGDDGAPLLVTAGGADEAQTDDGALEGAKHARGQGGTRMWQQAEANLAGVERRARGSKAGAGRGRNAHGVQRHGRLALRLLPKRQPCEERADCALQHALLHGPSLAVPRRNRRRPVGVSAGNSADAAGCAGRGKTGRAES